MTLAATRNPRGGRQLSEGMSSSVLMFDDVVAGRVLVISASFATFEPCESHTMHEEAQGGSCQVVSLSHRYR